MPGPTTVDEYLATLPDDVRAEMERIRAVVVAAAPGATESLAYNMPALRSHGDQFLVSYDAYKRHYSLFPASDAVIRELGAEVEPYLAGKGTIRFPKDRPIPLETIRKVVEIRFGENAAKAKG